MKDAQLRQRRKRKLTTAENETSGGSSGSSSSSNGGGGRQRRTSSSVGGVRLRQDIRQLPAPTKLARETIKGSVDSQFDEDEGKAILSGSLDDMTIGDVVWARLSCRAPWWPAAIIDPRMCGYELNDRVWVFWLGDSRISDVDKGMVKNLSENFSTCFRNGGSQNYMTSVRKAIEIYVKRCGHSINDEPIEWAVANFAPCHMNGKARRGDDVRYDACLPSNCNEALPEFIISRLAEIRELQESKLSGDSSDESGDDGDDEDDEEETNVHPPKLSRPEKEEEDDNSDTSDTNDSNSFSSTAKTNPNDSKAQRAARRVIVSQRSLNDFCLCCGSTSSLYTSHPMFEGRMCKGCCTLSGLPPFQNWYKEVCFVYDQDGKKEHCSVCGCGGDLLICDHSNCANVFCNDCIVTLDSETSLQEALDADPWGCYLCTGRIAGLLRPKKDWEGNVFGLFKTTNILDDINLSLIPKEKRPIRVLSLFDGVGTGKVVLDELGLDIGAYYCSEIDEDAVLVTRVNHPKAIVYLGDVRYVDLETLKEISPIDLLIGGSPCNDISIANPKRRGLYDPEGTGILFFEYYRILQTLLQINAKDGRNLFWIFENVASMREQYRSVINRFLGKPPALFDSCHFSAQNRARYFWGNIPGMYNNAAPSAQSRPPIVDDILTPHCGRVAKMEKVRTVTTRTNSLKQGRTFSVCPVVMDGKPDTLWPTELEKLFGLPRHYTDVGSLSPTKRQKLIGQGWTVPVVKHIMRPLQRFYKTKDSK